MTRAYRFCVVLARLLIRVFFRRVEVSGRDQVPERGGGLLVAWHPNGLVDPFLILGQCPRRVVFGARHGLFSVPVFGWLLRSAGTVPIYRAADASGDDPAALEARRAANARSLDALAQEVARGQFAVLFPEGLSHDEPHPVSLRSGAARLYYRAHELWSETEEEARGPEPVIVPIGLHYDRKQVLGSRALVVFHPPLELDAGLRQPPPAEASDGERYAKWSALTAELDRALHDVVHATESWQLNQLMHRVRKLVRAERMDQAGGPGGRPDMRERVAGFARVWAGYAARRRSHPDEVERLLADVHEYDEDLRALGIEDHELDRRPRLASLWLPVLLAGQLVLVYLLMPPILVLGLIVNAPTAFALLAYTKSVSALDKDEASLKLLLGAVLFPLTWLAAALLVAWGQINLHERFPAVPGTPVLGGVVTFLLCGLGGYLVLHYRRLVAETARAVRVRLTRARRRFAVARLRKRRQQLYARAMALTEGLELPGRVGLDGKVALD